MNGYEYILAKQTAWAAQSGIPLVGSKVERGRPAYTCSLDENLFRPLLRSVRESFAAGDGGELGSSNFPGKMQAVHSSSALGVNVFQYWIEKRAVHVIAALCGLCRSGSTVSEDIQFEEKYPISDSFGYHPNIDAVIHNGQSAKLKRFGIECKFSEAYGAHRHGGLKPKYLELHDLWKDIPNLHGFAQTISPDDRDFRHLHPAQLVKHILGLKRQCGRDGFRLLYLWYDVLGAEAARHRDEVERFATIAKLDGIRFHSMTYQELIVRMKNLSGEHTEYVNYLASRYL
jgi:hypothetical protein